MCFDDRHFREDLQWNDAVPMLERLTALAKEKGLEFGVKLTNTFPVDPAPRPRPSWTGPRDPARSLVCCNPPISVSDCHLWAFAHPVPVLWEVFLLFCHLADTAPKARLDSEPCPPQSCLQTLKPASLHHGCNRWVLAGSPQGAYGSTLSCTPGLWASGVGSGVQAQPYLSLRASGIRLSPSGAGSRVQGRVGRAARRGGL